jgi:hypothetical protein
MHMKRMIAAAVAVLGLAMTASAQGPIQGMAAPGCAGCAAAPAYGPTIGGCGAAAACERPRLFAGFGLGGRGCRACDPRFGLNPFFHKLMFWKRDNACGSCGRLLGGCGFGGCGGGYAGGQFNPYPNGVPGTLVYPYNPYIRSPRDWYEK